MSSFSAQAATFGDINGDGWIDVVIGTVSGTVWALDGRNGGYLGLFRLVFSLVFVCFFIFRVI